LTQIELDDFDVVARRFKEAEQIAVQAQEMADEVTLEMNEVLLQPRKDYTELNR